MRLRVPPRQPIQFVAKLVPQKPYDLFNLEWPIQLGAGINPPKHRYPQAIVLHPLGTLGYIEQLDQQSIFNQRQYDALSLLAQMASQGSKQLAFRQAHDKSSSLLRRAF
jgi:hypothetical protein